MPSKKIKYDLHTSSSTSTNDPTKLSSSYISQMYPDFQQQKHLHPPGYISSLYHDLPPTSDTDNRSGGSAIYAMDVDQNPMSGMTSKLGLILPNPAPEVAPTVEPTPVAQVNTSGMHGPNKSMCFNFVSLNFLIRFFFRIFRS